MLWLPFVVFGLLAVTLVGAVFIELFPLRLVEDESTVETGLEIFLVLGDVEFSFFLAGFFCDALFF
jgi:hypothetical protein